MKRLLPGLLLLGVSAAASAGAQAAPSRLQFSLDREGPPATLFTILLGEDGAGVYSPRVEASMLSFAQVATEGAAHPIRVGPALARKIFAAVPMVEGGRCETHNKNIAKSGVKVLQYQGAGHDAQCTYNFSDDDRVNDATAAFEGLAETLQFGDRLRSKLRFDRLGLDGELDSLQSAVTEGRALEVANISPVLQSIVADERVMDRARRRAERLLQSAAPAPAQVPGTASLSGDPSSPR